MNHVCLTSKHTSAHGSVQTNEDAPQPHSTHKDEDHTKNQGYHTKNNTANPHTHQNAQEEQKTAAGQNSKTPADQLTLQRGLSLNQGDLGPNNHGNVISIHGPSHQGPRSMLEAHTITWNGSPKEPNRRSEQPIQTIQNSTAASDQATLHDTWRPDLCTQDLD